MRELKSLGSYYYIFHWFQTVLKTKNLIFVTPYIKKGLDVKDYGDISYKAKNVDGVNNMSHLGDVAGCTSYLSEKVQEILKDDRRVLTIGGDHSVGIGTIDGHVKV